MNLRDLINTTLSTDDPERAELLGALKRGPDPAAASHAAQALTAPQGKS